MNSVERLQALPQGWVGVPMGDVSAIVGGGTPSTSDSANFENGQIPWITPADLSGYTDKFISRGARNITERGLQKSSARLLPRESVLMSSRAPIGYVAIASVPLATNQGFKSFILPSGIDSNFVYYLLLRSREEIQALGVGTTFKEVSATKAATIPLPLPPLPEQRRIVAEIDKQFTRLDASVAVLKRAQANLKRYRASVLKAACEGKLVPTEAELARLEGRDYEPADQLLERILSERRALWESQEKRRGKYREPFVPDTSDSQELPEGWVWATVDQLILGSPQNGIYKPKSQYGNGVPVLRIDDYQDFYVRDREQLQRLKITAEETSTYGLVANQLVINRVNSPSHLGKTLLVPDHFPPAVFESNMMKIILNEYVAPPFVAHYLRSTVGRVRLTTRAKWAVNQASINQSDVCMTPVPLPPIAEQRRIVAEVERRLPVIQQAEATVKASLSRAERLRQSILKQAFSGKLVPQDPSDEPASVLLERIRLEREASHADAKISRQTRPRRGKSLSARQLVLREGNP